MDYEAIILRKLFRHRIIGGKHTAIEHLTHSLPKHAIKEAKKSIEELIKKQMILTKPTSYGLQISLNPTKIKEIIQIIEENKYS